MSINIEDILGIIIPIIFFLVLAVLGQLPAFYAGIRKTINDFNAARADGDISPEEFQQLCDNLTNLVGIIKSGYSWLYEYLKNRK